MAPEPRTTLAEPPSAAADRVERWAGLFVLIGVVMRASRYLLRYPLWHDEAFIAANFIDSDFGDLAGRLDYLQVSPILFLWVELAVVKLLGFSEWTLRLFPTLCSIGGLFLFRRLARRTLTGWSYPLAVAFLAVAAAPIRHGNEVKSYATDLLAAVVLLWIAVEWLRGRRSSRGLWLLAIATPIALAASLPAVFVAAGIGLVLLLPAWRAGRTGVRCALAGFAVIGVTSFLALLRVHLQTAQSEELRHRYLIPYWSESFPPLREGAAAVASWFARIHAGNLLAYPVGEENGGSILTLAAVLIGCVALWRSGRRSLLALLLVPFGLNLIAAGLQRYPYGGEARIAQHLVPAICLLAGLGVGRLLERVRDPRRTERYRRLVIAAFLLVGAGLFAHDLARPYHMATAEADREFARWFWEAQAHDAEVACLKADLGLDFEPHQWVTGISASYLCNRRIYGPPARTEAREGRPTRLVLFQVDSYDEPSENPAFRDWLTREKSRRDLCRVERFTVNAGRAEKDWKISHYWVYEFAPVDADTRSPAVLGSADGDRSVRR